MNESSEVMDILASLPHRADFPAWNDPIHTQHNAVVFVHDDTHELIIFTSGGVLSARIRELSGDIAPYCS
jgi:hypothetical protein